MVTIDQVKLKKILEAKFKFRLSVFFCLLTSKKNFSDVSEFTLSL